MLAFKDALFSLAEKRKQFKAELLIGFLKGYTLAKRKLELVFIDKDDKFYPLDEVSSVELAEGLRKISEETAKRISLQKEQR